MTTFSDAPLQPRDGQTLWVLIVCRISTIHQEERSLDDQEAYVRKHLEARYKGKIEYRAIKTQGSGEWIDREELREMEQLVSSRKFDVVAAEDTARITRHFTYYLMFLDRCHDAEVRVITVNDPVDTARSGAGLERLITGIRHEMYNQDTSARIRRALRGRFETGHLVCALPYGYIKPEGAKSEDLLRKDPAAEPFVAEIFRRVEAGGTFAEVAAWLNEERVPTGPSARSEKWTAGLVGRFVRNPILKGVRYWNRRIAKPKRSTGRHHAVKAPASELLVRMCPHLAFIDSARFDRLQRQIQERNGKFSRAKNGADPRANVPKKRTFWPGGHALCGICGRPLYWGGHGRMDRLICSGSRRHQCWNSCTANGAFGAHAILHALLKEVETLSAFNDELTARIRCELDEAATGRLQRRTELDREIASLDRKSENLAKAIANGADFESVRTQLQALNAEKHRAMDERALLDKQPKAVPPLPDRDELRRLAAEAIREPPLEDPEFQRMMRALLPQLHLVPYRLCNEKKVVPRAKIVIDFLALSPEHSSLWGEIASYRKEVVVDLFKPSQHVRIREELVRLRGEGKTTRESAKILGVAIQTVNRALAIQRAMDKQGLADPWVELKQAPDDIGKMKSHRSKNYKFEPLDGFPPVA